MTNGNGEHPPASPGEQQGDGRTEMAIGIDRGRVVIHFPQPVKLVAFNPPNAVAVAQQLLTSATECGYEVTLQLPKRKIRDEDYAKLLARAALVIRSLEEKNRPPAHVAREVVDVILSAVL